MLFSFINYKAVKQKPEKYYEKFFFAFSLLQRNKYKTKKQDKKHKTRHFALISTPKHLIANKRKTVVNVKVD